MEGGDPSPQPSPLSTGCIVAGSCGAGLPSFWCAELKTEQNDHRQYLVREEHATQFGAEFPECAGSNILSVGQTIAKATHEAKLTTVQRPAGYVCNTQAARPQRFVTTPTVAPIAGAAAAAGTRAVETSLLALLSAGGGPTGSTASSAMTSWCLWVCLALRTRAVRCPPQPPKLRLL